MIRDFELLRTTIIPVIKRILVAHSTGERNSILKEVTVEN